LAQRLESEKKDLNRMLKASEEADEVTRTEAVDRIASSLEELSCINDKTGDSIDENCSKDAPLCNAGFGEEGIECVKCINDKSGDDTDTGCSSDTPLCVADVGQPGSKCVSRLNVNRKKDNREESNIHLEEISARGRLRRELGKTKVDKEKNISLLLPRVPKSSLKINQKSSRAKNPPRAKSPPRATRGGARIPAKKR